MNTKPKKILFVDDNKAFVKSMGPLLEDAGFKVVTAHNGVEAISLAEKNMPDLVLLDVKMPGLNGIDLCRVLRKSAHTFNTPIIMLTGEDTDKSEILGLRTGANDYIAKPCNPKVLIARIEAALRVRIKETVKEIREDGIYVNSESHSVAVNEEPVDLRPKEFDLLYFMMINKEKVCRRTALMENVWGDCFMTEHVLDETVGGLRKKLGPYADRIITIKGVGYKYSTEK